ncbi:MAG: CRISPR-associated protein Csx20 [Thermodesulfobacteriota bacterium]|nr:CRISPR-associated protein Csx20 [Thermodesulfobacteriota bacterium]
MPNSLFLIFNHRLTQIQKDDARASLGVGHIINLPTNLEKLWQQIPVDLSKIDNYLAPIKKWLSEQSSMSDYVLIQGDFGATFIIVQFAFEKGLIPIYSTSRREAVEEHNDEGTVKLTHNFKHVMFRKYGV